jgi:hypothetical protein
VAERTNDILLTAWRIITTVLMLFIALLTWVANDKLGALYKVQDRLETLTLEIRSDTVSLNDLDKRVGRIEDLVDRYQRERRQ